ncbi:hypothetical protein PZS63_00625 [Klebsiella aerogenes]|uniref:hypothetical protein n=1 Tax=Klebsiella aerogenes TaxID=548 RepID=UPI002B26B613|nr:hypothetical protein [Klebsiella aerogenes]MEA8782132.1 hypothetical protein [Klebsiella aerogenes]
MKRVILLTCLALAGCDNSNEVKQLTHAFYSCTTGEGNQFIMNLNGRKATLAGSGIDYKMELIKSPSMSGRNRDYSIEYTANVSETQYHELDLYFYRRNLWERLKSASHFDFNKYDITGTQTNVVNFKPVSHIGKCNSVHMD